MAPKIHMSQIETAKTISGPFVLFNGGFIIEFLEPPPDLDATVLMKATYPSSHPLSKLGKSHPQAPPLHLHLDQSETFIVASGKVGTTLGWEAKDVIWEPGMEPHEIVPYMPHNFWPCPEAEEDSAVFLWAHPTNVAEPMDWLFFQTLLCFLSDVHEQKVKMDMTQVMISQHASATAMIMFPRAWWLGPLRWWLPWRFQGAVAALGRMRGYRGLVETYTPKEEWEAYLHAKRA